MPIDLNEIYIPECRGKCNKQTRQKIAPKGICHEIVSKVDGLPIRCVGSWSKQKVFYLLQYFSIFTKAMHKKWNGNINYVEICCGTGRCIARDTKIEFDGTTLAILKLTESNFLSNGIFVDFDNEVLDILEKRLVDIRSTKHHIIPGDYNDSKTLVRSLQERIDIKTGLTLFFIDPTDCSVPFTLIARIKNAFPNSDFIINVAIGTDFTRNVVGSINNPSSYINVRNKYIRFLGSKDFFSDKTTLELAEHGDLPNLRTKFREYYVKSLFEIGLTFSDFIRVRPYYDIIFASQHNVGLKFWKSATKNEFDGQKTLDF
jgi:three-Cys-motif partner protein